MYSIFLEHWLTHLGHENVLAIRSEDYFSDDAAVLKRVFTFLDIDAPDAQHMKAMRDAGRPQSSASVKPVMLPEARQLVADFYAPWNKKLAELLGDDFVKGWV
jgi:hypothetical protein